MNNNLNLLQKNAKVYLTEAEYQQFVKFLQDRNSDNISIRMYANAELSKMARSLMKQVRSRRNKRPKEMSHA